MKVHPRHVTGRLSSAARVIQAMTVGHCLQYQRVRSGADVLAGGPLSGARSPWGRGHAPPCF